MSYRDFGPQLYLHEGKPAATEPVAKVLSGATMAMGGNVTTSRTLPDPEFMMVGPWCLVEHFWSREANAPLRWSSGAQPASGSQQLSWLHCGELMYGDSRGNKQALRPGRLGVVTTGSGIMHGVSTLDGSQDPMSGVSLRLALPSGFANTSPAWEYHSVLPVTTGQKFRATVFAGELDGMKSPATTYSPLFGTDIVLSARANLRLPMQADFEYAALVTTATATIERVPVPSGSLMYLGMGRNELAISADEASRILLLGGRPLDERLVMWRGFVARDRDEIERLQLEWATQHFDDLAQDDALLTGVKTHHTLWA